MGIKYSFVDNEVYGTEDINEIVSCLTGAGIAPFPTQDTYNTSDLNTLTEALTSSGTSLDGCKCTVSNTGAADMCITVSQGIIFFESGVRLTVDVNGYTFAIPPNVAGYIIAHYNPALQFADIIFSAELPSDGEWVELAQIANDGTLKDTRVFSRSKIASFGTNLTLETEFAPINPPIQEPDDNGYYVYIIKRLENVDISKFNYALIHYVSYNGLFDIKKNVFLSVWRKDTGYVRFDTNILFSPDYTLELRILVKDNMLIVRQRSTYNNTFDNVPVTITLI